MKKLSRRAALRRTFLGAAAIAMIAAPTMATGLTGARPDRAPAPPSQQAKRPNVIVILVDDMGFSDIGSYGSEIPTPNLDRLAAGGLRFTQFYNSARCSPSRASLLTGLYPQQAGMANIEMYHQPESKGLHGRIDDRAVTMPQLLGPAGYFTAMAGKWHLGDDRGTPPEKKGFQHSFNFPGATYFPDQPNRPVRIDGRKVPLDSPEVGKGYWYSSDLLVDWTTRYVDEARAENKPYFLYLAFPAPHFPVMAPPEDIARFKGKYKGGWEPLRRARLERQKKLGLVAPDAQLSQPLDEAYDWDALTPEQQDRFDTIMAVYAAAISRMDKAVGTLLDNLEARGELDNTLILFMSDNGGNAEMGPDGRTDGQGPMGSSQSRIWVGLNWAMLQNTPFRYFKHYTDEGGISTPLIVHWPKGIDPRLNGTYVRAPGHLIDVMPTILELAKVGYPASFEGHALVPAQGRSMVPAFSGQPLTRDRPIFWEHEGNRAVRDGKWKAVGRWGSPWELYDMDADRTETTDVAARHPEIVARMAAQYEAWAEVSYVDPWPERTSGGVEKGRLEGGGNKGPKAKAGARKGNKAGKRKKRGQRKARRDAPAAAE